MSEVRVEGRKWRDGDSRRNYMKIYELIFELRTRRNNLDRVAGSGSGNQRSGRVQNDTRFSPRKGAITKTRVLCIRKALEDRVCGSRVRACAAFYKPFEGQVHS